MISAIIFSAATRSKLHLVIALTLLLFPFEAYGGQKQRNAPSSNPSPLAHVRDWGYQLQKVNPKKIARSSHDLVVIDYSRNGRDEEAFTRREVQLMRSRPKRRKRAKKRRLVIAYLSIGEAEDYRYYWSDKWKKKPASWLGAENPNWKGNYQVKFWHKKWKKIIFAYLDKIIDAGFDGIYLDRVDAYVDFAKEKKRERQMIHFVEELSAYARKKRKKFIIIGQNAESLLRHERFRNAIHGLGKEDLLFGIRHDGKPNRKDEISWSNKYLLMAKKNNIPVFVVEYLKDRKTRKRARRKLKKWGYVPTFSIRDLDKMSVNGR